MDHQKTSNHHCGLDRRAFLDTAGGIAGGALFEAVRPGSAWGQQPAKEAHGSSARALDRIKTRLSFQISVDVGTLDLGLTVAAAGLAGGGENVAIGEAPPQHTRGPDIERCLPQPGAPT